MAAPTFDLAVNGTAPHQYATEADLEAKINAALLALYDDIGSRRVVQHANASFASTTFPHDTGTILLRHSGEVSIWMKLDAAPSSVDASIHQQDQSGQWWQRTWSGAASANALRESAILRTANIGGTGDAITADLAASAQSAQVTSLSSATAIEYIPAASNAAQNPTFAIAGTTYNVRDADGAAWPAGGFVVGRAYVLRRRGSVLRVSGGDVSVSELRAARLVADGADAKADEALLSKADKTAVDNAVGLGALISLSVTGTSTAYVGAIRTAHANAAIGLNSQLAFAPNATSGAKPTLTIGGVTREIKDVTGADLVAGALAAGAQYLLRVYSETEIRLVSTVSGADAVRGKGLAGAVDVGALISLSASGTGSAYAGTVRAAHAGLVISANSQLAFVPHVASEAKPTLTIGGVTREIKDVTGGDLVARALVAGTQYILRVYSETDLRLVSPLPASDIVKLKPLPAAVDLGAVISIVVAGTAEAYTGTLRAAHANLSIVVNSQIAFSPNVTSAAAPTLTIGDVTREIKDIAGAPLPAGSLVVGAQYILRVYSNTELRLVSAMSANDMAEFKALQASYRIRNSAGTLSRPGVNPVAFARSYIGTPDTALPCDLPVVDLGANGGRVLRFANNGFSIRERFPINQGQRYKIIVRFRVVEDSAEGGNNVTIYLRLTDDAHVGLSLHTIYSARHSVDDGWQTVEVDTASLVLRSDARLITPYFQHVTASGVVEVQTLECLRVVFVAASNEDEDDEEEEEGDPAVVWAPPYRPNVAMAVHNDYPVYRNWGAIPYAPLVLHGSTGYYVYSWPNPRVAVQVETGRKIDCTHMVRGTMFRYICRTGTGGIFAGYGGTFFGQSGANYVSVPAGSIVEVTLDASTNYRFLTVQHIAGPVPTFSTIAEPIANKTILYGGQSLAAQAYQMGGPGGFNHAESTGWGGVTAVRDTTYFVNGAEGGTTLDKRGNATRFWWNRDTDTAGPVLLQLIDRVNAAVAAGQPRPTSMLWNQGQSDATYISQGAYTGADYKAQLAKVLDYIQTNALGGSGKIVVTTISRADRTGHNFGANAVRVAQMETIAQRADCWSGCEEYDLSGEGGLDVHLSPKGYFVASYRLFRSWYNAMHGASISIGPIVSSVAKVSETEVRVAISGIGSAKHPIGRGMKGGVNFDFGPTPYLWGAIDAAGNQVELEEGSFVGNNLFLKSKTSLVGCRLIYPFGYANGWREALFPMDGEAHIDYEGHPLRSYLSAVIS